MGQGNRLWMCALLFALACGGDDGEGGTGDGAADGTADGAADGQPNDGASDGSADGSDTGGDGASDGTSDGSQADGSGDGDPGPTDGSAGEGACQNEADLAIIAGTSTTGLACEGAVCAGQHIADLLSGDTTGIATCAMDDAPTLKQLSPACQQCFVDITVCVPKKCVSILGGEDACSGSPSSDFATCDAPPAADAKCDACSTANCQPDFKRCSGLE